MKSTTLLHAFVLGAASFAAPLFAASPTAIAEFSTHTIDLYEAPQLSAPSKKITVPQGKPGKEWLVLDNKSRFYQIQAGPHGIGWALRSNILVDPESPIVLPPCKRVVATSPASKQHTGGVAGASSSEGC